MTAVNLIPYALEDVIDFIDQLNGERGLLGELPKILGSGGIIFGLTSTSSTDGLNPDRGYHDASMNKLALISKFFENPKLDFSRTILLLEDPWATAEDYTSELLKVTDYLVIDDAVYVKIDTNNLVYSIHAASRAFVSSLQVFILLEGTEKPAETADLVERSCLIALEAYDGQGWLIWTKKERMSGDLRELSIQKRTFRPDSGSYS